MSELKTETRDQEMETPVASRATVNDNEERLLKIAVIGTGNCGCMMVNQACAELGIDGIAINGSQKDLDLVDCPRVLKVSVGDGKGTGKDRDRAKSFFLDNTGMVLDKKFNNVIEANDVIVITTSTGGGYGSGSSTELLELLQGMYENKIFIMVGVLPFSDEGVAAFEGTKAWLREVIKLNPTFMLYDNNRFAKRMTSNKAAAAVNSSFVADLRVIQGDYISTTRTGGIDQRDMITVLSVPGRIIIDSMTRFETADIEDGSIIGAIKKHIDNESAHADMVTDKQILASAFMYTLGDSFDDYKINIKADLQETFGSHIKDMSNFSDEDGDNVAIILSGLTEPTMVIDRIINKSQKLEEDILARKSATSKLNSLSGSSKLQSVTAKQSFADETVVATKGTSAGGDSKEALLKKFMEKKSGK